MHWFNVDWWKFLLMKPAEGTNRVRAFLCRKNGHPAGVYFYNPNGFEPDMHCKGCEDDLG